MNNRKSPFSAKLLQCSDDRVSSPTCEYYRHAQYWPILKWYKMKFLSHTRIAARPPVRITIAVCICREAARSMAQRWTPLQLLPLCKILAMMIACRDCGDYLPIAKTRVHLDTTKRKNCSEF